MTTNIVALTFILPQPSLARGKNNGFSCDPLIVPLEILTWCLADSSTHSHLLSFPSLNVSNKPLVVTSVQRLVSSSSYGCDLLGSQHLVTSTTSGGVPSS